MPELKSKYVGRYPTKGKCFWCGKLCLGLYCGDECQDEAMKWGGECRVCGLLTKGEPYCSQECENEDKR